MRADPGLDQEQLLTELNVLGQDSECLQDDCLGLVEPVEATQGLCLAIQTFDIVRLFSKNLATVEKSVVEAPQLSTRLRFSSVW